MPIRYQRAARWLLLLACVLTLALLVLTVAFIVTKYAPTPADRTGETSAESGDPSDGSLGGTPDSVPNAVPDAVTLPETPDAGLSYQDSLIFVGDARTAQMVSRGALSGGGATTQVWRTESGGFNLKPGAVEQKILFPGPGEHTGKALTVADAAALAKPRVLIVTLGAEWGASYLSEEDFKACYAELIRAIRKASPETAVVLQSIFPVTATCPTLTGAQIDTANRWVKAVADETGCRYLDTGSALKDENGYLKAEYCLSGGMNLTEEGYAAVLAYIRTHALTD